MLRRAVGGYERLVRRFTAQTTDYQVLLSTFAEGLYTELDFRNEALNNVRMRELIDASEFAYGDKIVIPKPLLDLTTRCVGWLWLFFRSPHSWCIVAMFNSNVKCVARTQKTSSHLFSAQFTQTGECSRCSGSRALNSRRCPRTRSGTSSK